VPYVVTPRDPSGKGGAPAATKGTVPAAVGVVALEVDAPSLRGVTDQKEVLVAGQTLPNGAVTVNGEAVKLEPNGAFTTTVPTPSVGEVPIDVVATGPQLASRTMHLVVKRAQSLDAEAKALEASSPSTYDAAQDVAAHVGEKIVVEGPIVDTRAAWHQTIIVVTDRRGCAAKADPNQCLARVLVAGEDKHKKGDVVRVFGRISRPVQAQNGKTVPEIEADLVAKPLRGRG
jgi:hypothetical protein